MKNECAVVKDLAIMYYDKSLSPQTVDSVEEHLNSCDECREFYNEIEKEKTKEQSLYELQNGKKEKVILASDKIKKYRLFQVLLFGETIIFLLSLMLTWFGYRGVSEIKGTVLLTHPLAIAGLGLLEFSIWYSFTNNARRKLCGYAGAGALLISEFFELGIISNGNTAGIDIGFIHLDLLNPMIWNWDFPLIHWGFYAAIVLTVIQALSFRWFCNKITA